jgi:hypothetical protein
MFIGGRLHRQFREVASDGSGNPTMAYYRNPIPPKGLLFPLPLDRRVEATECEEYRMRRVVSGPGYSFKTHAIVYVLQGIDEYYLNQAYLEEPGIMDQLEDIAT